VATPKFTPQQPHRRELFHMPRAIPHRSPSSALRVALASFSTLPFTAALLFGIAPVLWAPTILAAQTPAQASPQDSSTTQPNTHPAPTFHQSRNHLHPIPKQPQTPPAADTTAAQALVTPAPEPPHWPAHDHPAPARIVWDSQGLRIEAANSSLSEILTEVSNITGAHVDGFASDARVYGQYGPGPARDILSQLLEGTGYNVIMIGDLGQGAPRQIVLSTRTTGSSLPAARTAPSNDDDADVEEPAQAQPQQFPGGPPMRAPFNPAGMRNPQQFPPDLQQRQQGLPGQQPQPGQPQQNPQQPNQQ
jgi:hypothetical protein